MNADQFQKRMSELPEPKTDLKPPYWQYWRLDLWRRAQTQDPTRFWEWPCIFHTMMVTHWKKPVLYEFSQLPSRLEDVCQIPHFGPDDNLADSPYSMNLVHQAYHVHQWETATGKRIDQLDTIVEFGGGYGAMALLCHRLGFEGKYIIYDLPEFSLLQEYYLSQFGLLANVTWNPKRKPKDVDLFMALYSLSEVPIKNREVLICHAKSHFFLYSGQWEGWDNVWYFQQDFPRTNTGYDLNWQHTELTHLPDLGNFYSVGW